MRERAHDRVYIAESRMNFAEGIKKVMIKVASPVFSLVLSTGKRLEHTFHGKGRIRNSEPDSQSEVRSS